LGIIIIVQTTWWSFVGRNGSCQPIQCTIYNCQIQ